MTCVGGGLVARAEVMPQAAASLAPATVPLAWMQISSVGGRVYRFAKATIPHGVPKRARVQRFGTVVRRLTDGAGGPQASTVTTVLVDTDRTLRQLANAGTLQSALVEYFVADLSTLKTGADGQRVFRGRVHDWSADAGLTLTLTVEDDLTARLTSADAADTRSPLRKIDKDISDTTPRSSRFEQGAPEVYGNVADDTAATPLGVLQLPHTTSITLDANPALGNMPMFLVSAQVCQRITHIYAANPAENPPINRVPLNPALIGVNVFIPGYPGWPLPNPWYETDAGRWTVIFMQGHLTETKLAVEERIPITVNVCGYEAVGNGSGNVIDQPARAFLHWFNNRVLQDVGRANWQPLAMLGDFSLFDTTTFDRVSAVCDARGYRVAGVLSHDNTFISWRERVAEWCRNFGFEMGINRHGQVILNILDRTLGHASARRFSPALILDDGVDVRLRTDAVENIVPWMWEPNYLTTLQRVNPEQGARGLRDPHESGWIAGYEGRQESRNDASIARLGGAPVGERRAPVQEYSLIRVKAMASRVAAERLAINSLPNGRAEASFRVLLRDGWDVELGDIILLEHWDVPWSGARRCDVREVRVDLDDLSVTITARDVDDLLPSITPGTLEALMTGGITSPATPTAPIETDIGIPIEVRRP